mmetsp:Transcript_32865/g.52629  ORF Transcript_32865/g.52629 Transcript_32865/m.52629 type:complete len:229 (-) Transcript_32865:192-878(-)
MCCTGGRAVLALECADPIDGCRSCVGDCSKGDNPFILLLPGGGGKNFWLLLLPLLFNGVFCDRLYGDVAFIGEDPDKLPGCIWLLPLFEVSEPMLVPISSLIGGKIGAGTLLLLCALVVPGSDMLPCRLFSSSSSYSSSSVVSTMLPWSSISMSPLSFWYILCLCAALSLSFRSSSYSSFHSSTTLASSFEFGSAARSRGESVARVAKCRSMGAGSCSRFRILLHVYW